MRTTRYIRCTYGIFSREITKHTVIFSADIWYFGREITKYTVIQCIYGIFGREITKYTVIRCIYTIFLAGKSPYIRSYTVQIYGIFGREITIHSVIYSADIWYFWQGNHQTYGHVQCIYTVFLAGKSPYIRSYTVYIWYFWQGNHQTYGHIRCIYTVFLAGKSPNIRSYTVYIYGIFGREITICSVIYGVYIRYFWQGNHQTYGHIRCIFTVLLAEKSPYVRSYTVYIYGIFGREITKHTVIYGVYLRYCWQKNHHTFGHIRCIYTVFLAGKSPNIRSCMVYIRYCWQGNHHTFGHIRCRYIVLANPICDPPF